MRRISLRWLVTLTGFLVAFVAGSAWAQPLTPALFYYASAPEVVPGGSVESALTPASGQNFKDGSRVEVVVLRADAGQDLVIDVESDEFDAFLSLYASDGTLLDRIDDGPTSINPRLAFTPDADGAYLLVVSGFSAFDLGTFEVSVSVAESRAAEALPLSGTVSDTLQPTDPGDPEIGYGATRFYEMTVEETSWVRLQAASLEFDTVLTLFDDFGWLDQNDDSGSTTDSELFLELQPGVYRVAVSAWGSGGGSFTLRADRYVRVD